MSIQEDNVDIELRPLYSIFILISDKIINKPTQLIRSDWYDERRKVEWL